MSADALARRRRVVSGLRLTAGAAWLALALLVFRVPLARAVHPIARAVGLDARLVPAASGFLLRVSSEPPGARLWVDGVERGMVPLFTNVACGEGEIVRLRVARDGLTPWEREVGCREGQTLIVHARLAGALPPP